MIQLKELTKKFSSGFQLGPVNLEISKSNTIALLGQNGAGKSTLFQLLTGNLDATSGEIYIFEKRLLPENYLLKRTIGYLPQHFHLPKWVTGLDILRYAASLYELEDAENKIKDSLKYWDAQSYQKKPLASLSHGMQKRIALALATIHNPQLLILDEPFSGLDLFHIRALENLIEKRQTENKITILSTHIAPYVAKLCKKVYTAEKGKIDELANWSGSSYEEKITLIENHFYN